MTSFPFQALVESIADVVGLVERDGSIRYISGSVRQAGGYEPADLVGRHITSLLHPDDLQSVRQSWAELLTRPGGIIRRDRRYRVAGLIVVLRDVTEQREVESRLRAGEARWRAMVDGMPECMATFATDLRLIDMNAAGLKTIEAATLAEAKAAPLTDLVHAEDRAAFMEHLAGAARGAPGVLEFRMTALRGSRRWLEVQSSALRDAAGAVGSILSVMRDISDRKSTEAVLKARAAELEEFHRLSIGRELQMIELKEEVNALARKLGRQPPYDLSFTDMGTEESA
jgi:PAS domain S-box-containing protein